MFKLPKVHDMPGDFRDRHEQEVLVGTKTGVYTVSSMRRCSEDPRWSMQLLKENKGSPKETVPGSGSSQFVAYSKKRESDKHDAPVFDPRPNWENEMQARLFPILQKDIAQHGPTPNCPGCRAASKSRAKHSMACRARFEELFSRTDEGRERVRRAHDRWVHAVVA